MNVVTPTGSRFEIRYHQRLCCNHGALTTGVAQNEIGDRLRGLAELHGGAVVDLAAAVVRPTAAVRLHT